MKTIGLIGGMSWESTIPYYRHLNEAVKARLGGLHSAKLVLFSVDFHEIERLQQRGDWSLAGRLLADAAQALERAGAELLADGNIHVYGPMRGRALAGIKGDRTARIFCQQLGAELLSIAGQYKVAEDLRREPLWAEAVQVSLSADVLNITRL